MQITHRLLLMFVILSVAAVAGAEEYHWVEPTRRYDGLLAGDEAYRMHEAQRWSQIVRQAELNFGLSVLSRPPILYPGAWYGVSPWAYRSAWSEPAYFPGPYSPYAARYGFTDPPAAPEQQAFMEPMEPNASEELPAPVDEAAEIDAPREF